MITVPLRKRIKEIVETRVRYGYRRIHVLLRREGWAINLKRVHGFIVWKVLVCGLKTAPSCCGSAPCRAASGITAQ